jgi:excisionase family DNA binding protein
VGDAENVWNEREVAVGHILDANRAVLTAAEASKLSGFTRAHINYLISTEQLDAVKVGSMWLVYEDSLRAYMASPRKPGPKPRRPAGTSTESSVPEA